MLLRLKGKNTMLTVQYQANILTETQTVFNTEKLLKMWVHGKSVATQKSYMRVASAFIEFIGTDLDKITLDMIQDFGTSISHLSQNSQKTYLSIVKSLISFIHNIGITRFNPGKAVKAPKSRDALNERILTPEQIKLMIESTTNPRNKLMLQTLYYLGLRVSELTTLRVRDLVERKEFAQATIFGKGGKTRVVLMPLWLFNALKELTADKDKGDFVFTSNKKSQFDSSTVRDIVKKAAHSIGVIEVSPHWLRHAHASHSLENGANINIVSQSLGHASLATTSRYIHNRPDVGSALFL